MIMRIGSDAEKLETAAMALGVANVALRTLGNTPSSVSNSTSVFQHSSPSSTIWPT